MIRSDAIAKPLKNFSFTPVFNPCLLEVALRPVLQWPRYYTLITQDFKPCHSPRSEGGAGTMVVVAMQEGQQLILC